MKRIIDALARMLAPQQVEEVCEDCQELLDMLEAAEQRIAELEIANRIQAVNLEILRSKTERSDDQIFVEWLQ